MKVRAQISMLFHLDKCIGCHTCSIACKNIWTDRKGAEYMWWNNVETRPGTGYPVLWEDQKTYRGGWERKNGKLKLKLHGRAKGIVNLFYNPALPKLKDYYEPFTFRYRNLFTAPQADDQPTAEPISAITGKPMKIESGPNWDDDLSGSNIYAKNDPNFQELPPDVQAQLLELENVVMRYLPRICNHCLNPSCVAACPSGAIYKREEDGVVLVNEEKCRGWRMCVSACPYKKVYYNWLTGKSEKCILCFPRLETGQAPACAHSCVGRIRYVGVLLYDADRIPSAAMVDDSQLVDAQLDTILDPFDENVIRAALDNGVPESWIESAQQSPVYRFVKEWGLALPIHPEFRTMAMMFYVPPLSPVMNIVEKDLVKLDLPSDEVDLLTLQEIEKLRLPVRYLARLFSAGDEGRILAILRKMFAVRMYRRRASVEGTVDATVQEALEQVGLTPDTAEAIYELTSLADFGQRFVIPPFPREEDISGWSDPLERKGGAGFGILKEALGGP
jgi:nitrate reductase beta subunit